MVRLIRIVSPLQQPEMMGGLQTAMILEYGNPKTPSEQFNTVRNFGSPPGVYLCILAAFPPVRNELFQRLRGSLAAMFLHLNSIVKFVLSIADPFTPLFCLFGLEKLFIQRHPCKPSAVFHRGRGMFGVLKRRRLQSVERGMSTWR